MSNKIKVAEGLATIAPFLRIGSNVLGNDGSTLDAAALDQTVEELEAYIQKQEWHTHMIGECEVRLRALQHYHSVYKAYEELLPLSVDCWQQWNKGLQHHFRASLDPSDAADALQERRLPLVLEYEKLFSNAFLGTSYYLSLQLGVWSTRRVVPGVTTLGQTVEEEEAGSEGDLEGEKTHAKAIHQATVKYFHPLHYFTQLSFFSEHLFGLHGLIGREERTWITDDAMGGDTDDEEVMEALVRRSFKRDSTVPSVTLGSDFKTDYDGFEIDEKKQKEMEKRVERSLKSQWNRNASELFEKVSEKVQQASNTRVIFGHEENAIADSLVSEWKDAAPHRALFFSLQRMIEYEAFPAVVNPARVEFVFFLLQRWFRSYIARRHRWSVDDPFVSQDDSDLFAFIVSRHSVLLKWSLRNTQSLKENEAVTTASLLIECMRTTVLSLLSCLHLYLQHPAMAKANPAKVQERRQQFIALVQRWVQETLIAKFARALLHDLNALLDANVAQDVRGELDVGLREAELRLVLCTALLSASPRSALASVHAETASRLVPIIDDLLSMALELSGATSTTSPTLCKRAAFTLLQLCKHYSHTCRYAYGVLTEQKRAECYRFLADKWKALGGLAAALGEDSLMQLVTEEWQALLLGQPPLEGVERDEAEAVSDSMTSHTIVEPLFWASDLRSTSASAATFLTPYSEKRRLLKRGASTRGTKDDATQAALKRSREE